MTYEEKNLQIKYLDCGQGTGSRQINSELQKASKICLVFDVTDEDWGKKLDLYLDSNSINLPSHVKLLLLGNKIDLLSPEKLIAVRSLAESYATLKGAKFVEYSAENNTNRSVLIDSLTTDLPSALSSSVIPEIRASFSEKSGISSSFNRSQLLDRVLAGNASLNDLFESSNDLAESSDEEVTPDKRAEGDQQTTPRKNSTTNTRSTSTPEDTNFSFALRYVGMALMVAALVNAIYLLLIAMNVFSAVALTVGMNHLLVTVGGLLGFAAPVTAFGNACAAIGLSTAAATGALSATGSMLMAGTGSLFRLNAPMLSVPSPDESARFSK